MIEASYPCYAAADKTQFVFQSVGPKGIVIKVIRFEHIGSIRWNVGFGDFKKGQIDITVISNNGDIVRILATVAEAILVFLSEYPDRIVEVKPVDEKRKRLYNLTFSRRREQVQEKVSITGLKGVFPEPYSPSEFYDSFEITANFEV